MFYTIVEPELHDFFSYYSSFFNNYNNTNTEGNFNPSNGSYMVTLTLETVSLVGTYGVP